MEIKRPDPDSILKQLSQHTEGQKRGKLKIFFGYAAGVGKTYDMLKAAHAAQDAGIDVVAGYVEPHARPQTMALLEGLEQLPPFKIEHRGITLSEFDLDAALKRKPQLILVDELAHSNAKECRHVKRYQDVEELLKAGINVYTTINVQHIESLNDIVASFTGVIVRERIPDSVFDNADFVELVDIEPDDLIARLNEGKIYQSQKAQHALGRFFTKENLAALREIALRRTADRVNKAAEKNNAFSQHSGYYTGEHILICLSSSPSNAKVIRTAARMSSAFHGFFTALFVETPNTKELSPQNKARLKDNLKLAQQLGANIATVFGDDIPMQISEYAKASGISKIVLGRSVQKKGWLNKTPTLVERLTQLAPNLDIYIIPDTLTDADNHQKKKIQAPKVSIQDIAKGLGILAGATVVGFLFDALGFGEANIITVYILGVLCCAIATKDRLTSAIFSILSVLVFNFFFTQPRLTLQAYDPGYPVTFAIMLIAALITSSLATRIKKAATQSSKKAYRTGILLDTSQMLQRAKDQNEILAQTAQQMIKLLDKTVILYPVLDGALGQPLLFANNQSPKEADGLLAPDERAVAEWAYRNNKHAGASTNTLPGAKCLYLTLRSNDIVFAVAAIALEGDDLEPYDKSLLFAMLGECALALEKEQSNQMRNEIAIQAQKEQLRANLLRAISHDLRTPLTSISGNAGILMGNSSVLDQSKRQQLYADIYDDSMWLINLVENLLSVTRIDNGSMRIQKQPELIEEVIQEALRHISRKESDYTIDVSLQDDLMMVDIDPHLIIQVVINMVNNAIQYTPPGSHITICAVGQGDDALIEIADDGPGIPKQAQEKLFDMFYTAHNQRGDGRRAMGLGLSLCKSIIEAHGGRIFVKDNLPHGTVFGFTLPQKEVNAHE